MRAKNLLHGLLFISFLMSSLSLASVVDLKKTAAAGSGCKNGNVYLEKTSDGAQIYFNDLFIQVQDSPRSLIRKNCNLAIPISLPAGKLLVVDDVTLIGISYLGQSASSKITTETFFSGGTGQKLTVGNAKPGLKFNYLTQPDTLISGCGQDTLLRTRATALLKPKLGYNLLYLSKLKLNYHLEDC
ncbi:MAG: DUF4360 domain-containing protein [Bacteriovoracaceae bacterium]|jgi:hypothetical protein|nr:DUF4360 domain-containing protein [Bacteriovoracaceae bacterium]